MQKEEKKLVMGALLHDVGKLLQRSSDKRYKNRVKNEYSWYKEERGVSHPKWGAYFLKELGLEELETLALRHHNPENRLEKILGLADQLSAGEREHMDEKPKSAADLPLHNIYNQITISENGKESTDKTTYFPLKKLQLTKNNFPAEDIGEAINSESYNNLKKDLTEELDDLVNLGAEIDLEKLHYCLQKYMSNVPSAAYYHKPDISLFDHCKTSAAISLCIYREIKAGELSEDFLDLDSMTRFSKSMDYKPLLLLGGDISGVQDFIYRLTSSKAAKGLKGRSAYLELLTDVLLRYIRDKLNLPRANILFSGGGNFYTLLPSSQEEELLEIKEEINRNLLKAHDGELAVVMGYRKLKLPALLKENFGDEWEKLHEKIAISKQQKFSSLLENNFDNIFYPEAEGGRKETCDVCGRESEEFVDTFEGAENKCSWCASFEELGKVMRNSFKYTVKEKESCDRDLIKNWQDVFALFGYEYSFSEEDAGRTYAFNKPDFEVEKESGFTFLATSMAREKKGILTFAELSERAAGIDRWGVLRADVDSLGSVFKDGLGDNKSVSRYATLSRLTSYFFSGWVNRLAEKEFPKDIHVIYSGGDDLFIVGSWSKLPEYYTKLQQDFKEFTGGNEEITLSGSIYLPPGEKYPLLDAAKEAGEELEEGAKNYSRDDGRRKDAVSFMDNLLGNEEFGRLEDLQQDLVKLLEEGVSRGILHVIYNQSVRESKKSQDSYPRIWELIYSFTKFAERHEKSKEELMKLEEKLTANRDNLVRIAPVAARWAEFLTREG